MNEDLENIAVYFRLNELVINLKVGKTECMVFGTTKRLSNTSKSLKLYYDNVSIHVVDTYKYLGSIFDSALTLNAQFNKMYKKASNNLKLLSKLKLYLTDKAAKYIFRSIILPGLRYNCLCYLNLNNTQKSKLKSFDRRVKFVVGIENNTVDTFIKHAVKTVQKCLEKKTCSNFHDYFTINEHMISTRNQNALLKFPKVKLEFTKSDFFFQGVKLFNALPVEIRKSGDEFDKKLKSFKFQ